MYPISHTAKSNYNFEIKEKHQLNLFPFYKTKFHKSEESLYISPNLFFAHLNSPFSHAHFIFIVLHSKTFTIYQAYDARATIWMCFCCHEFGNISFSAY